jgi:hypothetical protein
MQIQGDTSLCCAKPNEQRKLTPTETLLCEAYVRQHLHDSFLVAVMEPSL